MNTVQVLVTQLTHHSNNFVDNSVIFMIANMIS